MDVTIKFDLDHNDLIWRFDWSKMTIKDLQRSYHVELTAELGEASGEVRRKLFSGAG